MAELEERVARVEGLLEGITQGIIPRLDRLERETEALRTHMDARFSELRTENKENFR